MCVVAPKRRLPASRYRRANAFANAGFAPRRVDAREERRLPRRRLREPWNAQRGIECTKSGAVRRRAARERGETKDPRCRERILLGIVAPDADAVDEQEESRHGRTV